MRKLTAVLLLVCLCLAPVARSYAISGQFYDVFTQYYAENVQFINDCENRHLLPLAIASVPMQEFQKLYPPEVALERGTMFDELYLPFEGKECRKYDE